jgi:hypothetical protein
MNVLKVLLHLLKPYTEKWNTGIKKELSAQKKD